MSDMIIVCKLKKIYYEVKVHSMIHWVLMTWPALWRIIVVIIFFGFSLFSCTWVWQKGEISWDDRRMVVIMITVRIMPWLHSINWCLVSVLPRMLLLLHAVHDLHDLQVHEWSMLNFFKICIHGDDGPWPCMHVVRDNLAFCQSRGRSKIKIVSYSIPWRSTRVRNVGPLCIIKLYCRNKLFNMFLLVQMIFTRCRCQVMYFS